MIKDYKSYKKLYEEEAVAQAPAKPKVVNKTQTDSTDTDLDLDLDSIIDKIKTKYEVLKNKATKINNLKSNDGVDLVDKDGNVIDQEVYILGQYTDSENNDKHSDGIQAFKIKLTSLNNDNTYTYNFVNLSDEDKTVFKSYRYDGDELSNDKTKGKYIIKDSEKRSLIIDDKKEQDNKESDPSKCLEIDNKKVCIGKEYYTLGNYNSEYIVVGIGVTEFDKNNNIYFDVIDTYKINDKKLTLVKDIKSTDIYFFDQVKDKLSTTIKFITDKKEEVIKNIDKYKELEDKVQDKETDYSQTEQIKDTEPINKEIKDLVDKLRSDEKNEIKSETVIGDLDVIYNYIIKAKIKPKAKLTLLTEHIKSIIDLCNKKYDNNTYNNIKQKYDVMINKIKNQQNA